MLSNCSRWRQQTIGGQQSHYPSCAWENCLQRQYLLTMGRKGTVPPRPSNCIKLDAAYCRVCELALIRQKWRNSTVWDRKPITATLLNYTAHDISPFHAMLRIPAPYEVFKSCPATQRGFGIHCLAFCMLCIYYYLTLQSKQAYLTENFENVSQANEGLCFYTGTLDMVLNTSLYNYIADLISWISY